MLNLIATLLVAQAAGSSLQQEPPLAPAVHPLANEAFQRAAISVEEKLEKGDFAGASKALAFLPKLAIRIEWDDSKVPQNRRAEYAAARDRALNTWARSLKGFKWTFGKRGDLKFSFVPTLPPNVDTPIPAGAVQFFSADPTDSRVEVVLALKRSSPPTSSEAADIHNEVAFGLASYYGLSRNLGSLYFSTRTESSTLRYSSVGAGEKRTAEANLAVSEKLREAINAKKRLIAARPSLRIEKLVLDGGEVIQGEVRDFGVQLTNIGNGPLKVLAAPDCTCVIVKQPPTIGPNGGSALFQVRADSTGEAGDINKKIVLYANDPDHTVTHLSVRLKVRPLYRILSPNGNIALLGSNGGVHTVYFIPAPGSGLEPADVQIVGVKAEVTVVPWTGMLADPEMNEPERERTGFKIVVDYEPGLPPGRTFSSLEVTTNAKDVLKDNADAFEKIEKPIYIQNGIVAQPESLNVGDIKKSPQRFHFMVSRPGAGFKILKLVSSNPSLKLTAAPFRGDTEYRVAVQFDGRADYGMLTATFTVYTSDKKQPPIVVPFRAIVR